MNSKQRFETALKAEVDTIVDALADDVRGLPIGVGPSELVGWRSNSSELSVVVYVDDDVFDVVETFVWRDGAPAARSASLVEWFRTYLAEAVEQAKARTS